MLQANISNKLGDSLITYLFNHSLELNYTTSFYSASTVAVDEIAVWFMAALCMWWD